MLYFKHVCTDFDYPRFDRPSVTRGLTNDLSDAIDRVIESFFVFLCARHFSHAIKLPTLGTDIDRSENCSLNLYQFDLYSFIYAKNELDIL